jgi:DNA-binding transcriptional LysR family regulator
MDRARQLEMLVRATELGSFARAAAALDITPSAVSRAIAGLEKALQVPLFNRTTRQLQLTEDGRRVYDRAKDILERLGDLETAVAPAQARIAGSVRVGISAPISRHIVMPRLAGFIDRFPEVRLEFRTTQDPKSLHLENLDVLFYVASKPPDSRIVALRLGRGRPAAYASAAYLARRPAPEEPEQLADHRCLVFRPPWLAHERDEWEFQRGPEKRVVRVRPAILSADREGLLVAAMHGAGVVYMACFDPALIGPGGLVRLLPDWTCDDSFTIYLIHRRAGRMPARIQAFVDFCRQSFSEFDPVERTVLHGVRARAAAPRLGNGD